MSEHPSNPNARTLAEPAGAHTGDERDQSGSARPRRTTSSGVERGTVLDRYVLLSELGGGAMGRVFLAYDSDLARQAAIKVLREQAEVDEGSNVSQPGGRLLREAQSAAQLAHPNVTSVYGVGNVNGVAYIAMEYVKGRDLRSWMKTEGGEPRPWREILDVFSQAGRGLQAAHDEDLLHRDFKPDNVLLSDAGIAKVTDFGLAGRIGEITVEGDAPESLGGNSLEVRMTTTGMVMGTPAYMPPEQHAGLRVDPKADQYAFAASMYEALHGVRPFAGSTLRELLESKVKENLQRSPGDASVPSWLDGVVRRGLAPKPDDRWPSVAAMLEAFDAAQLRVRRRRWALGFAGVAVVAALVPVVQQLARQRQTRACEQHGAAIDEVWNDERRTALHESLTTTKASYAGAAVERLLPYFDRHSEAWRLARTESCLALHVEGRWDEDTRDRAEWCLDEKRAEFETLLEELGKADAIALQRAIDAAATLSSVDECRDGDRLRRLPPPPHNRVAVGAARLEVSRARALSSAGHYDRGLGVATQSLESAEQLDWPPLVAEAHRTRADLLVGLGRFEEAEEGYRAAYFAASRADAWGVAADAATALASVVGRAQARHDEGLQWSEHAALSLHQLGEDDTSVRRATLLHEIGEIEKDSGRYEDAKTTHEHALAIRQERYGANHPRVATSLSSLGAVHEKLGDYDEALALGERALASVTEAYGPEHPRVAGAMTTLAITHREMGHMEQAGELFERTVEVRTKALGNDHIDVASALDNLASYRATIGQLDRAQEPYEQALEVRRRVLGPAHPAVATSINNLGVLHFRRGEIDRAKQMLEQSLAIREKALGDAHPTVAEAMNNLAGMCAMTGELDRARGLFERTLKSRIKAFGPNHRRVGESLANLGNLSSDSGDEQTARDYYERALVVFERALGSEHPDLAVTLVNLGNTLVDLDEKDEGKRHLERALELREKALGPDHMDVASSLYLLADLALVEGSASDALPLLERAVVIFDAVEGTQRDEPNARYDLALALTALSKDRARALEQARKARDGLLLAGPAKASDVGKVEAWFEKHAGSVPPRPETDP